MQSRELTNRRQFLKLAMISAIGTAVVAACAPAEAPTPTPAAKPAEAPKAQAPQPTSKPAEPKPAPSKVVELRWEVRSGATYIKLAEQGLEQFHKDNPNIRVSAEARAPTGYVEKMMSAMAAGTAPDVFQSWGWLFWQYAVKGQLFNHNDFIKDLRKEDLDDFCDWQWKGFQIPTTNFRFGVPTYINMMVLYYDKAAFEEAKMDFPTVDWDHDNYKEMVARLTKKDSSGRTTRWGGFIPAWQFDRFQNHVLMYGGHVVDPNDLTKTWLDRPEAQEALEWVRKLMWDENTLIQPLQAERQWTVTIFPTKKIATAEDGMHALKRITEDTPFEWDIAHVPKGPVRRAVLGTTDGWAVWKGTKHRQEAWELAKFAIGTHFLKLQSRVEQLIPPRKSLLEDWAKVVREQYPKLEKVNLKVPIDALTTMGYPVVDEIFLCQSEVNEIIVPALEKVFITGGTPVSYFKEIKPKIEEAAGICKATFG
mgnify:CR=1 FL=1